VHEKMMAMLEALKNASWKASAPCSRRDQGQRPL